jgi:integrase
MQATWSKDYIKRAHYSLGLFLVQYLCNGFNLVDAGQLKYTQFYFDNERKAFLFKRKKTRGRAKEGAEVIIPIIEPLQKILDEIAAEPKLNSFVFPGILKGADNEKEIRRQVSLENSNVQDRVIKVCRDALHWEVRPSGTWCRHSFATNLSHAGVDMSYITESMGHSQNQSVTERYIASYPLDVQMKYNSKLLNIGKKEEIPSTESLDSMSKDEMKVLLLKLMGK